jgi:hypothetical protein
MDGTRDERKIFTGNPRWHSITSSPPGSSQCGTEAIVFSPKIASKIPFKVTPYGVHAGNRFTRLMTSLSGKSTRSRYYVYWPSRDNFEACFQITTVRTRVKLVVETTLMKCVSFWLLLATSALFSIFASAQSNEGHWVVTWSAAPVRYRQPPFYRRPTEPFEDVIAKGILDNQTVRVMVRTSIGGSRIRVRLTNLFGDGPLRIGSDHLGLLPENVMEPMEGSIIRGTDRTLLFSGLSSVTIPAGLTMTSDAVDLAVPPFANVSVTMYLPDRSPPLTIQYAPHLAGFVTDHGDFTAESSMPTSGRFQRFGHIPWLSAVEVVAPREAGAVVVLSDETSSIVSDPQWPQRLARRLAANPSTADLAVVVQATGLDSFTNNTQRLSILDRLDRDVLSQSGIQWILLVPFVHKIEYSTRPINPGPTVSPDNIAPIFREIATRTHAKGVRVIGGTITPFSGSIVYSEAGEKIRRAVNGWIRSSNIFDALLDFDLIARDPQHPESLLPKYGGAARRFPSPAIADDIELSVFGKTGTR